MRPLGDRALLVRGNFDKNQTGQDLTVKRISHSNFGFYSGRECGFSRNFPGILVLHCVLQTVIFLKTCFLQGILLQTQFQSTLVFCAVFKDFCWFKLCFLVGGFSQNEHFLLDTTLALNILGSSKLLNTMEIEQQSSIVQQNTISKNMGPHRKCIYILQEPVFCLVTRSSKHQGILEIATTPQKKAPHLTVKIS